MHNQELLWFRDNIANPRMQQLLQNTTIPDGYCCITSLDISILDGRSCGVDSQLKAEGLLYQNGNVEPYAFETYDFEDTTFFEDHKSSIYLSSGTLHVQDELQEMDVTTVLSNLSICASLFPALKPAASLTVECTPLEYLKMKQLLVDGKKEELNAKIQAITEKREGKASSARPTKSQTEPER